MRWLFLALVALSLLLLDSRALAQEDVPAEEAVGSGSAEPVDEASPLTEEEKQKLQSLWVAYIQRYLTQPCLVQLQGLMTAKEEERDALNAAFQGMCDDEMKKVRTLLCLQLCSHCALLLTSHTHAPPAAAGRRVSRQGGTGPHAQADPGPRAQARAGQSHPAAIQDA